MLKMLEEITLDFKLFEIQSNWVNLHLVIVLVRLVIIVLAHRPVIVLIQHGTIVFMR